MTSWESIEQTRQDTYGQGTIHFRVGVGCSESQNMKCSDFTTCKSVMFCVPPPFVKKVKGKVMG